MSLFSRLTKTAADVATSKATQRAATMVVDKVGPHRAISKVGTVVLLVGLVVAACGWFFLSSWLSWLVVALGVAMVALGYAMRGFNSFLVDLVLRLIRYLAGRVAGFVRRCLLRRRATSGDDTTPS